MSALDPADLHAREAQREESERQRELKREQQLGDFRNLMSLPWGRRIVWRLLSEGGVFKAVFDTTPTRHAWLEGQRKLALMVLHEVNAAAPELYERMVKENRTA